MTAVTVLMSVFNSEKTLPATIDSILSQSFSDFELIVVDDGSTDGSAGILMSFAKQDRRVRVLHQENLGLTRALNVGLLAAKGEWVARHDADDLSLPTRLERQVTFLKQNPDVVLVGVDFEVMDDDDRWLVTIRNSRKRRLRRRIVRSNPFVHGGIMFRRIVNDSPIMYDDFYIKAQDYDLVLRLAELGDVAILSDVLYKWRFSRTGIVASNVTVYGQRAHHNHLRRLSGKAEDRSPPAIDDTCSRPSEMRWQLALAARYLAGYRRSQARECAVRVMRESRFLSHEYKESLMLFGISLLPMPMLRVLREF